MQGMALQGTEIQVKSLEAIRHFYANDVAGPALRNGLEVTHDYENKPGAIPLPATLMMKLNDCVDQERPGAHVFLYSDYPFPWRRSRVPNDAFATNALEALRREPDESYYRFEAFEGRPSLRYAIADRMAQSCVDCHNRHPDSPKRDWKVGDVRGVLEFVRPMDNEGPIAVLAARSGLTWSLIVGTAALGCGVLGLVLTVRRLRAAETAAREAIAESHQRKLALDHYAIVSETDTQGRITYANDQFCRIAGFSREELLGRNHRIVNSGFHSRGFWQEMYAILARDGVWRGEVCNRSKGGSLYWVHSTNVATRDADGRITGYVSIRIDITQRKELEEHLHAQTTELEEVNARLEEEVSERLRVDEELRHSALHDALTGLPNRNLLLDRLDQGIKRTQRQGCHRVALLFIDLDNFKLVNDSLGHDAGDELLIEAARRIVTSLRDTDCAARIESELTARLGGDEFVVLLDGIRASEDAVRVCIRIQQELGKPLHIRGHEIKMGGSIGIALNQPGQSSADLIRDADTAMYRAKAAGKGGYAVFDATMHAHVRERLQLENDLRRAIEDRQLTLHYQPIVDMATARTVAFEALVRWQHPEKGLVSPADFIPIAEETGLIVPLGDWVLEESLRQLEAWNRDRSADAMLGMNVNVSRRQLMDSGFVTRLEALLDRVAVPRDKVRLEITESLIVLSPEHARPVLERLVRLGVELHLDDFGTGLSSLSCLKDFPLAGLKVDRTFIKGTDLGRPFAAILHAIVTLSHNLGLRVVAEGVENRAQLAAVLALECDFAQGFMFSKPVPAAQAEAFIDREFDVGGELLATTRRAGI